MYYFILGILVVIIIIMGFIIRNLLLKNEKQEDILENQEQILSGYMIYLTKISEIIEKSDKKLQEIDYKGSFKADDEVGFMFEQIKSIQTILNSFNIKNL